MKRRFWRMFRLLVIFSAIVAAIAIVLVTRGAGEIHASLIIASGAGVFFTVLLGTGLMTLQFVSSESGYDEAAADHSQREDKE
ncbi:MAG TPA: hypothetical protein VGM04_07140 [Sphingomicrobium sp.]|jgi:hypothetical protein